jgi:hypothetical protein
MIAKFSLAQHGHDRMMRGLPAQRAYDRADDREQACVRSCTQTRSPARKIVRAQLWAGTRIAMA